MSKSPISKFFGIYCGANLNKLAKLHRDVGISFQIKNDGARQYVKIDTKNAKVNRKTFSPRDAELLNFHMSELFPRCYVTSGCHSSKDASLTFRINP